MYKVDGVVVWVLIFPSEKRTSQARMKETRVRIPLSVLVYKYTGIGECTCQFFRMSSNLIS